MSSLKVARTLAGNGRFIAVTAVLVLVLAA